MLAKTIKHQYFQMFTYSYHYFTSTDDFLIIFILIKNKKRTIPLSVSAPFHCSLMKPAASQMEELINKTKFNIPSFQIISNVTSLPIKDPGEIKKLLIQQIFSTVKWRESIINISKSGVNNFFEIGPGKVLTGMVKRTLKDIPRQLNLCLL